MLFHPHMSVLYQARHLDAWVALSLRTRLYLEPAAALKSVRSREVKMSKARPNTLMPFAAATSWNTPLDGFSHRVRSSCNVTDSVSIALHDERGHAQLLHQGLTEICGANNLDERQPLVGPTAEVHNHLQHEENRETTRGCFFAHGMIDNAADAAAETCCWAAADACCWAAAAAGSGLTCSSWPGHCAWLLRRRLHGRFRLYS